MPTRAWLLNLGWLQFARNPKTGADLQASHRLFGRCDAVARLKLLARASVGPKICIVLTQDLYHLLLKCAAQAPITALVALAGNQPLESTRETLQRLLASDNYGCRSLLGAVMRRSLAKRVSEDDRTLQPGTSRKHRP
jgi:hypothetical protein